MIVTNISCACESPVELRLGTKTVITGDALAFQPSHGPQGVPCGS